MEIDVLRVERVGAKDIARFREMVAAYWRELMPRSDVINDPERWEAFFHQQFGQPYWMLEDGEPIGLVAFQVSDLQARVDEFYIVPERRRLGYGTVLVKWLFTHLDSLGVERIDLDVRRDNPGALAFWEAQGFGLAGYRLRMYRDPESGTAFVGALCRISEFWRHRGAKLLNDRRGHLSGFPGVLDEGAAPACGRANRRLGVDVYGAVAGTLGEANHVLRRR